MWTLVIFRPVSVLPVVSKVFERLLHQQLYDYLQKHIILHPAQSGFRPQHTTQNMLVRMVDDWRKALDENKYANDSTMSHAASSASELEAVLEKDLNDVAHWVD